MDSLLQCRMVSALTKARLADTIEVFPVLPRISALRGERIYFALLVAPADAAVRKIPLDIKLDAPIAATLYAVEQVPVRLAHYPDVFDEDYIGHEPGLYPDLLRPATELTLSGGQLSELLVEAEIPRDFAPGTHTFRVTFIKDGTPVGEASLNIDVIDAVLPPQKLTYTQWMQYDCIATQYRVPVFSSQHWKLIESFVRSAVHSGINALLTPIFTPPLDTAVGGERPTVQLVDVTVTGGAYTFGFDRLKRFCRMARRCGIQELEISHLFTQWGAEHAPKIMATTDGQYRRLFGWETDATSPEYVHFLRTFLPQLKEKLDAFGFRGHYFFHISDEPNSKQLESYRRARDTVYDLICDHPVRDALSHYEYYEKGLVSHPIPATNHADTFVAHGVPDLWVYYCCSQGKSVSNRFIAMPGHRTRVLGAQMFKAGVTGFLHWGYNFYYTQFSRAQINPFLITDGGYFAPAGDTFSVYPGEDGKPLHSLREVHFYMGLCDMRAMDLAAERVGRERVIAEIDRLGEVDFLHYPTDPAFPSELRERVNNLIKSK